MKGIIAVLALGVFAGPTMAAAIFVQTPTLTNGHISDVVVPSYGAAVFNLGAADTVRSVIWQGLYGISNTPAESDSFTINFYADASGVPGLLLQSFFVGNPNSRTDTGFDVFSNDTYEFSADLGSGIDLSSDIDYWISIFNDTTGEDGIAWFWGICEPCTSRYATSTNGIDWESTLSTRDYYFVLDNSNLTPIPIPAAVWLFGSAVGLLGWMRRKTA
jgi:hypothetical protein